MKIRKRITITFVALFGVLTVVLCLFVYFVSARLQETVFFDRLNERVKVTEEFFLESDVLSSSVKQKVRNKFLQTLPGEIEYVSEIDAFDAQVTDKVQQQLPENFLTQIKKNKSLQWNSGRSQGVATVYHKSGKDYVVLVIAKDKYGYQHLRELRVILIVASLLTIASAFILSAYFSRQVLKPIAEKIKKANKISASELDLRLTVYNEKDELGMLATSFNSLLDRLQESLELEKNFVRYASHELKNPLTIILGESEVALMSDRTKNEYIETIVKIKEKADKLNDLVDHFLKLSRMESSQLTTQPFNIDELLVEIIFELSQSKPDGVELQFNVDDRLDSNDLEIVADRLLINKALFNLIQNAVKFSGEHGQVLIGLRPSEKKGNILISIKDLGQGIAPEDIKHIYKALYRGSNTEQVLGTGIGLALVKKIIDLHNGTITVVSASGKGTTFTVELNNSVF